MSKSQDIKALTKFTNQVLYDKSVISEKKDVYYIPGYFRIKVKNFTQMDLDNLSAQMNVTIIFSIYYGILRSQIVESLKKDIILLFGRDDAIQLVEQQDKLETKVKQDTKKREIQFTIRKMLKLRIESEVFWSPFEIINLILSVTVQPVVTDYGTVKINLQDHKNNFLKMSYTNEGTFGNYDLAQKLMRSCYTNYRDCTSKDMKLERDSQKQIFKFNLINKTIQNDQKIDHFQYAHFNIPLYKFPMVAVATIFLPLWLLAIINLGIFYQDSSLSDRIASIAALMIAFVALIPTIREQIPPNPKIILIEYVVYLETFTSLLALIDSLNVMGEQNYSLDWRSNGLFLVSCIITLISFFLILVLMLLHYLKWQPNYNKKVEDEKDQKFDRNKDWENQNCDLYFTLIHLKNPNKFKSLDKPEPQPYQKLNSI